MVLYKAQNHCTSGHTSYMMLIKYYYYYYYLSYLKSLDCMRVFQWLLIVPIVKGISKTESDESVDGNPVPQTGIQSHWTRHQPESVPASHFRRHGLELIPGQVGGQDLAGAPSDRGQNRLRRDDRLTAQLLDKETLVRFRGGLLDESLTEQAQASLDEPAQTRRPAARIDQSREDHDGLSAGPERRGLDPKTPNKMIKIRNFSSTLTPNQ